MTDDTYFQCLALEPKHTRVKSSVVALVRTDTTQQGAQAQGEQTERNRQLTQRETSRKNDKLCGDMPTLPLGLIVPDGHEDAFFYSLAEGRLAPRKYSDQNYQFETQKSLNSIHLVPDSRGASPNFKFSVGTTTVAT